MSITILTYVYCDGHTDACLFSEGQAMDHAPLPNQSAAKQREAMAKHEGVVTRGSRDYCKGCAAKLGLTKFAEEKKT